MVALVDLERAARPGRIRGLGIDAWTRGRGRPDARAVFGRALRAARALHSAERRLVQDALYGLVRQERGLIRLLGTDDPLALWLGWLVRQGLASAVAGAQHRADFDALARWDELACRDRHSLPDGLADRLERELGAACEPFLEACDARAPLTVRANRARTDRDRLAARLLEEGVRASPTPRAPDGLVLEGRVNVEALPSFREGWFEVQDEASQLVVALVASGGPVVDFCAGAGGKSLALAANGCSVTSLDVREAALEELRKRARRAGAVIRTRPVTPDGPLSLSPAPAVLVDAPCSGTGVLRRHPELRWSWSEARFAELVALQAKILDRAASLVAERGRLVYATCSVLVGEDEAQVEAFLSRNPRFEPGNVLRTWPHVDGGDGFYAAVLQART